MTVGFHSPLPPARTGVADYSASLAAALSARVRVALNPTGPCDTNLYHLGNNPLHNGIYARALSNSGVVVLHDAVLTHFLLGYLDSHGWVEEFVYNYGEWHRGLASELWQDRTNSGSGEAYFRYPMLKRVVSAARAVIVHNPAAVRAVRRHVEKDAPPIIEIPHLFAPPPVPGATEIFALRRSWTAGPRDFVFGVFGYLREPKRLPVVCKAFRRILSARPEAKLLVAGDFISPDLERNFAAATRDLAGVIRVPHLPERDFWLHAHSVDACINLRYPTACETSGIAIRMMGIGKPVLVTSGEEVSRYPEAACLRVDPGAAEQDMLEALMLLLVTEPARGRAIGECAQQWIARHHAPDAVAEAYLEVLTAAISAPAATAI